MYYNLKKPYHLCKYLKTNIFFLLFSDYKSVSDVLTRIKSVSSEAIVKQVGAIYVFDVSGE